MLRSALLFIYLMFSLNSVNAIEVSSDYTGVIAGIEVIGVDLTKAQEVKNLIPYQVGEKFSLSDMEKYKSICQEIIENNLHGFNSLCSCVLYDSKRIFLAIDIFPSNLFEKGNFFRKIPEKTQGNVAKLPKDILEVYLALENRKSILISQNKYPIEIRKNGYIDYEDQELHKLATSLVKITNENNDILLDIVRYSKSAEERRTAAILFSWSNHPENIYLILEWNLLLDPDMRVRNNVARSYVSVMQNIEDKALLKRLIPIYCKQASLPMHTDRNKALVSIWEILQSDKSFSNSIDVECKTTIRYLSQASILENVGGTAKNIISMIDSQEKIYCD